MNMEHGFELSIEEFTNPIRKYYTRWAEELINICYSQSNIVEKFVKKLCETERLFISGEGRSGLVGQFSGNRFMHTGLDVYYVQAPLVPAIRKDDVLIAISGSGETDSVVNSIKKAKKYNAITLGITAKKDSTVYKKASYTFLIPSRTKDDRSYNDVILESREPISYLGSEFEIKALMFLELLANCRAKRLGITENDMRERHSNF
jgi:6-phospho-3-hexuloisomerase